MTHLNQSMKIFAATTLLAFMLSIAVSAQHAKYVFYFVGDGMGLTHVAATEAYLAAIEGGTGFEKMNFSTFPAVGIATNHAENRLITGSAAAGTSLATGHKTTINTISMDGKRQNSLVTIAEKAHNRGFKVGIISSVSINHATPAAFYAHQPSRSNYYEISLDLINSGFNFFGGGGFNSPTGKNNDQPSAYLRAGEAGYTITYTIEEFERLQPGADRVIALGSVIESSGAMRYAIDQDDADIPLHRIVAKASELLENENGFFIMTEEGKIDWAAHANDATTVMLNIISLAEAVDVALDFYEKYPDQTLIVVTSDHETGGMTLGWAGTSYQTNPALLQKQTISSQNFTVLVDSLMKDELNHRFSLMMHLVNQYYGLGGDNGMPLSAHEMQLFKDAWDVMLGYSALNNDEKYLRYGGGNPLAATATRVLNNKAGIAWTTWSHTGAYVPVYAIGRGHELFNGYYDLTDIPKKIEEAMGIAE
jgi:alkaline phosphatase